MSDPSAATTPDAPVYLSRREARAALDATASLAGSATGSTVSSAADAAPTEPRYDGVASLFPLLGDVSSSPIETPLAAPSRFDAILAPSPMELGATQAIPAADVAAELATPVAAYVVPQSAPVQVIPAVPAAPVYDWDVADVADVFGLSAADPAEGPSIASRRGRARGKARAKGAKRAAREGSSGPRVSSHRPSRGAPNRSSSTSPDRNVPRSADERKSIRQRIFGVGVMVLVGGLFAVLALPAYADNDASSLTAAEKVQTQKLSIDAAAAASTTTGVTRDTYTATSAADLKALYANAIRQQNLAAYLQSGAKAQGDDYPWFAELSRNQGGGLSPLNYYYRECVDFVAWRLNRDAGSTSAPFKWTWSSLTPSGGNASQWKSAWLNHGWATGATPVVGSVAWFPYNHVAYVSGILNSGQVLVEEYNWSGQHMYGTRVINPGDAYYLYSPN